MASEMPPNNLKCLLENCKQPLVFHNFLDWDLLKWNLDDWQTKLDEELLSFRLGKFQPSKMPQWEKSTKQVNGTFKDFLKFCENANDEWLYFDYKYLKDWFLNIPEIQQKLSWKAFGFPNLKCHDCTIWIGSKGAHTPCHIDTYGFNLVAQVYGRKRWILFPPEENLFPTRIPYEESSIYSKINLFSPDERMIKGLTNCRSIVLNPGDVLFVPHGWWHYVENLDIAISINVWIPMPTDEEKRLEESIVQMLMAQVLKDLSNSERETVLQTSKENESLHEIKLQDSLNLLENCRARCKNDAKKKKTKSDGKEIENFNVDAILRDNVDCIKTVPALTNEEFREIMKKQSERFQMGETHHNDDSCGAVESVLDAITHPDTINVIKSKLLKC